MFPPKTASMLRVFCLWAGWLSQAALINFPCLCRLFVHDVQTLSQRAVGREVHEAANPRLPLATEAQLGTALRYPSLLGRRESGRAKMADGLEWHAVSRPFYLGYWCHSKLLVTVFSLAIMGLRRELL